ncbi:MAG: paraquat-inducible protein A [Mucilaginibacter polytrichastri]|nr:paraquat-inducible protein A [Mucilaginibacter polytrichastri]
MRKTILLHKAFFLLSILGAIIILVAGVSTAMIDVEARISEFRFTLLGEDILFKDQILFFQSKSILDVVSILVKTGKFDSVLVGSLIFCFSILFPFAKLSSTVIYLFNKAGWMRGRVIKYFAFESGKWSMADVMVVAIMMTYIGFNGILDSQLASLNIKNDMLSSITTNNTALQPGYILFVAFVLFGLFMSGILKRVILPAEGVCETPQQTDKTE